jgi:hypothetical protein
MLTMVATLIKKKRKFSSYIRKFRMEQLQLRKIRFAFLSVMFRIFAITIKYTLCCSAETLIKGKSCVIEIPLVYRGGDFSGSPQEKDVLRYITCSLDIVRITIKVTMSFFMVKVSQNTVHVFFCQKFQI